MASLKNVLFLLAILNLSVVRGDCEATSKVLRLNPTRKEEKSTRSVAARGVQSVEEFWQKRNATIALEAERVIGHRVILDKNETEADSIVLGLKQQEYARNPFLPSVNFMQVRQTIEQTELYKLLRKMPKGANLFGMILTSIDPNFYYKLTFNDNLYFRFDDNLKLIYAKRRPGPGWRNLSRFRQMGNPSDVEELNNSILDALKLPIMDHPEEIAAWTTLERRIDVYINLTSYRPNFLQVYQETLRILYEDNIMYAELRFHFPDLYDIDGVITSPAQTLVLCQSILDDFIATHEGFKGIRLIFAPIREVRPDRMPFFRQVALSLWETNPKLFAGFGFLRREFLGQPLSNFVEELLKFPREIRFFFAAGITYDWGVSTDYNLIDALIIKSTRISEALALFKHPLVEERLREEGIAIEICPLISQVVNYVQDLRMHPNIRLLATDYPVVIGNFGGGLWNATGVSYDLYETFMAMTPQYCGLRCLKQLALNSWMYSTLTSEEKENAINDWQIKWDIFVDNILKQD